MNRKKSRKEIYQDHKELRLESDINGDFFFYFFDFQIS